MTRYQKLEKAKNESLKKWEDVAMCELDPYTYLASPCGFCHNFGDTAIWRCDDCPVANVEGMDCFETDWWVSADRKNDNREDMTSFALAVMVYIHGFTVADLPEETK